MRRPWIKVEICTPDKPEVCSLATQLRLDEDTVMGKLVRLWSWAEMNRINANDLGVTREFIDRLVGRKGFAQALEKTGWLIETDGKLSFPNFKRHNSPVAQNKALTAKRVARHRLRKSAKTAKEVPSTLPEATAEKPIVEDLPEVGHHVVEVIIQDESLISNDEIVHVNEIEVIEDAAILSELETDPPRTIEEPVLESPTIVAEPEAVPSEAVEESVVATQTEDLAPRKRRGKAASAREDQPMLF